jgi:hypothetical protein
MATNLINKLKSQGSTFYAMSSPNLDLTNLLSEGKIRLSKFACLNLPNMKTPILNENFFQINGIQSAVNSNIQDISDLNISLAQHFQNYVLNFEELILKQPNYVRSNKTTSERIFFK